MHLATSQLPAQHSTQQSMVRAQGRLHTAGAIGASQEQNFQYSACPVPPYCMPLLAILLGCQG